MLVRLLKDTTWEQQPVRVGQEIDVPVAVGRRWCNRKIAEEVQKEPGMDLVTFLQQKAKELKIPKYTKMDIEQLKEAVATAEAAATAEKEAEELAALKLQAESLQIEGFDAMTKEQLIEAIKAAENGDNQ